MKKTLGGSLFICNGLRYDYCFEEAIKCLLEFCDKVCVCDAGSDDGTVEVLKELEATNPKLKVLYLNDWSNYRTKFKLSHFTNIAIEMLDTDYNFNLQGDEVLSERSYDAVRRAIAGGFEAIMCKRINLWGSPYTELNVPHHRKPCSTEIIRLAKTKYRSIDDAESIDAQCVMNFVNDIEIWHYGFIRKREVMKAKIINMQRDVFELTPDAKLDNMEVFDSTAWFSGTDLKIISRPHPKIMKEWIAQRP